MAAAKLKLLIEQGATFRKLLTWKAGDPPVPVDLTGCSARMHMRPDIASETVLHALTTENGGIALGGADGTIELLISDADTAAFTWPSAVYDLEVIMSNGDVRRLIYGTASLSLEVTR